MIRITLDLDAEDDEGFNTEIDQVWDKISIPDNAGKKELEHLKTELVYAIKNYMIDRCGLEGKFKLKKFSVEIPGISMDGSTDKN